MAELARLFAERYRGEVFPDDDSGLEDAIIMLHHLSQCAGDPERRMSLWLAEHAPWMSESTRLALTAQITGRPIFWRADTLARRLALTAAERCALKIKTIGAIDQTSVERAALRKELKRQAQEARRRKAGVQSLAERRTRSVSALAPWEAEGLSRSGWYRRRKRKRTSSPTRIAGG